MLAHPSFLTIVAPKTRHAEMWIEQDTLHLFYSRADYTPERILVTRIDLLRPWKQWTTTQEEVVLEPERVWEGHVCPGRYRAGVQHELRCISCATRPSMSKMMTCICSMAVLERPTWPSPVCI